MKTPCRIEDEYHPNDPANHRGEDDPLYLGFETAVFSDPGDHYEWVVEDFANELDEFWESLFGR